MAGKFDALLEEEFKPAKPGKVKSQGSALPGGFNADEEAAKALAAFDSANPAGGGKFNADEEAAKVLSAFDGAQAEPGLEKNPIGPNILTRAAKAGLTGIFQGALPGDLGERMAKGAGVDDSLLYNAGRAAGTVFGGPEKFIAGKAFQLAGKIPGGYQTVRGVTEAAPGLTALLSRLAQRTVAGAGMGATEQGAKELIAQSLGERKDLAESAGNVASAAAEGGAGGATFGSFADYLGGKVRSNKIGEWLGELPFRSNALGKAKLNSNPLSESPRQTPVQAMQELGLTGSRPEIKNSAVGVVDKVGPMIGEAKKRAFALADQSGEKIPPENVLGGLVDAYVGLQKIPGESLGATERAALGNFIQDLSQRLGAKNLKEGISPRELDSLVELNKKFLGEIGERGNLFRQELDPSGKLSAEIRAIRRFIQDAEGAVDRSVVQVLGPSDGRAYLANNKRYGQGRDVLRLVNSADAERSGAQAGNLNINRGGLRSVGGMASSVIPTSWLTHGGQLLTDASRINPVERASQSSPLWNLIGISRNPGIQSRQDVQRLISAGVQNGSLSPQDALNLIAEVLREGSAK